MRRTTLMGRLAGENCPSYAACGTSYGKKAAKKASAGGAGTRGGRTEGAEPLRKK